MTGHQCFVQEVSKNRKVAVILERFDRLALPQVWLTGGCLFQTIWNLQTGWPADRAIKDYDLFYFDRDRSAAAEQAHRQAAASMFADLNVSLDIRNQARVPLWYEAKFGQPCPDFHDTRDGIRNFLFTCSCIALRRNGAGATELFAPHGFDDLYQGRLRPNPLADHRDDLFTAKAKSYRARWPHLRLETN